MMGVMIKTLHLIPHRLTSKLMFAHSLLLFCFIGPHTMSLRKIGKYDF